VLPEGVMLNYLSRRVNPSRFTNMMMTEMITFGGATIADDLARSRPDFVLLVHKNTDEFGVGFFGHDRRYGARIMDYINAQYSPLRLFGAEPFVADQFGIKILGRK
jgi:hypothetical protein